MRYAASQLANGFHFQRMTKLRFKFVAFGIVANTGCDHRSTFGFHWAKTDLNGKLAAIFTTSSQVGVAVHFRFVHLIGNVVIAKICMQVLQLFRYQHLYGLTDQFMTAVVKHVLRTLIHKRDITLYVHHQYRIWRELKQVFKLSFFLFQSLLRSCALHCRPGSFDNLLHKFDFAEPPVTGFNLVYGHHRDELAKLHKRAADYRNSPE